MGGAAYARSGVLYHGTDPTNSLLLPLWRIGRAALSPAGVAHLPDKVVCIWPLLLYLYVSLALGWAFFVQDHQLNRCRPGNRVPIETGSLVFVGVTRVA